MTLAVALQESVGRCRDVRSWVYLGEDTAWRIRAERGPLASADRVPTGDRMERLASELRTPYLELIGELSETNASLEWWASELAAKNPFAMLFPRICALGVARELVSEGLDDALIVCSTPALAGAVADETKRAGRVVRTPREPSLARLRRELMERRDLARPPLDLLVGAAPRRLVDAWMRHDGPTSRAIGDAPAYAERLARDLGLRREGDFGGPGTTLLVTWSDARSVGPDGDYRDPHFGQLPELLEANGERLAYVPRVLPTASRRDAVEALMQSGARIFAPEVWVAPSDWRAAHARARGFRPRIPAGAAVAGLPVAALVHEHVARFRYAQGWSLAHAALVRNLAAAGVQPERVLLPFEGHAWEQVVTAAVHEQMPETHVIGYDNVNFSRMALSLYPARRELGLRPLPDRVVANGPAFARTLEREGFPKGRIRVGCGLRHAYVWDERSAPEGSPPGAPLRVLAAGSIDVGQTMELIEKAVAAFSGDDYHLVVKLHPAVDRALVRAHLTPAAQAASFRDAPIGELLQSADVMLYTYSVVCYEALAHGVAALFVKSETFLDLDQLEPFPDLGWRARSVEELRAAAGAIAARDEDERRRWRERAREALAEALRPVSSACAAAFLDR